MKKKMIHYLMEQYDHFSFLLKLSFTQPFSISIVHTV